MFAEKFQYLTLYYSSILKLENLCICLPKLVVYCKLKPILIPVNYIKLILRESDDVEITIDK